MDIHPTVRYPLNNMAFEILPTIPPEILNTIFLTFSHNQDAIGYSLGIFTAFVMLLTKPSRFATLLLIGFITLLFGFEYNKHIVEPLQAQTLDSLGIRNGASSTTLSVTRLFQKLVPFGLFMLGWGCVLGAVVSKTHSKEN